MKKLLTVLCLGAFIFASCEKEGINSQENLIGTAGKGKVSTLSFGACDEITASATLYAGQFTEAGVVTVAENGSDLEITFTTLPGFCLAETHLAVGDSTSDFPVNGGGNPMIGNFEFQMEHDCATSYTYVVENPNPGGEVFIAAHAVVNCVESSAESIDASLPMPVFYCINGASNNLWNVSISDSEFTGTYDAYCVDLDTFLGGGDGCEDTEASAIYNSLDIDNLPAGAFEFPENFGAVNWLLNNIQAGVTLSTGGTAFTTGDIQMAIWLLVDGDDENKGPNEVGGEDPDRIDELMEMALQHIDFVPGCDEYVGIILVPYGGKQPVIFPYLITCEEGDCEETAWADGCPFPGNNWATYFIFEAED